MAELAASRRDTIRRQLAMWGRVSTAELAERFGVSERTVQRDLDAVAGAYAATRRVHGGLVTAAPAASDPGLRIGMLVPVSEYYYADVIAGASAAAAELNVRLVLGNYEYREDLESTALRRLGEVALDGLIATVRYESGGYHQLQRLGLTSVVIERPWHPARTRIAPSSATPAAVIDHVFSDHETGATIGLRHLVELGHRSIGCLVRPTATSVGLLRGLRAAIADLPCTVSVELQEIPIDSDRGGPVRPAMDRIVERVVEDCRSGRLTALFVHADWDALEIHRALLRAQVPVPDQVSLLAYDDVIAQDGDLTAVSPQRRWIGRLAMETVVDRLRSYGQRSYGERPSTQLSLIPELVVRSSTAGPVDRPPDDGSVVDPD